MKKITQSFPAAMLVGAIELVTGFARAQSAPAEPPPQAASAPPSAVQSPQSQEKSDEQAELLLAGKVHHGGYGAPEMKVTRLASTTALMVGGQGAWLIGHSVMIGGGGWGSVTSVDAPDQAKSPLGDSRLQFGYGGFRAGYVFFPQRLVHVTAGLLIGGGGISLTERHADPFHTDETDTNVYRTGSVFVLEPDVAVEINLNTFMRAAIDVSYRYVGSSGIAGISSSTLSALAGGAMLKFGSF